MNFNGIIAGAAVFLSIGICHPAVIKMEYYLGKQSWWLWLVPGEPGPAWLLRKAPQRNGGKAMKRFFLATFCLLLMVTAGAQEKKLLRGFDGGMMVHTGYLSGNLDAIGYQAKGAPMGIGGVIRLHLGEHFRIGSEGYVSTLSQRGNGSYLKYGWGGLLADFCTVVGRFQPYAGLTLGGGSMTTLLMFEEPASVWAPIDGTVFHKQGFMAIDPFVGCDFIVAGPMHLTLKVDYLCALSESKLLPHGPRVYFGFLFYH